jgi:hypothetical protein
MFLFTTFDRLSAQTVLTEPIWQAVAVRAQITVRGGSARQSEFHPVWMLPELARGDPIAQVKYRLGLAGPDDRDVVLKLHPARFSAPREFGQWLAGQSRYKRSTLLGQPVDRTGCADTLAQIRPVDVAVLKQQSDAQEHLRTAAEKQSLYLVVREESIIGLDRFQNMPVALCKAHRRSIDCLSAHVG